LARHGETEWAITEQHTGLTDLPLTARGERNARFLKEWLRGVEFRQGVGESPDDVGLRADRVIQRARSATTCYFFQRAFPRGSLARARGRDTRRVVNVPGYLSDSSVS